jgi:ABC-type sugar transport system ATPase subunit
VTVDGVANALDVRRATKWFGRVCALDGVDLHVAYGEVLALLGDNGAGKSTLLKIISGAIPPDEGQISIGGKAVRFRGPGDASAAGIAMVYQDLALVDARDTLANLYLGREPTRWGFVDRRRMVAEAGTKLAELRITLPSLDESVENLSGGQRQAVAIARAVMQGSKVIILDEPTAALSVPETERVLRLVRELRDRGVAVILVSHNMQHALAVADRVLVLRNGRSVGSRPVGETNYADVVAMITGEQLMSDLDQGVLAESDS